MKLIVEATVSAMEGELAVVRIVYTIPAQQLNEAVAYPGDPV